MVIDSLLFEYLLITGQTLDRLLINSPQLLLIELMRHYQYNLLNLFLQEPNRLLHIILLRLINQYFMYNLKLLHRLVLIRIILLNLDDVLGVHVMVETLDDTTNLGLEGGEAGLVDSGLGLLLELFGEFHLELLQL